MNKQKNIIFDIGGVLLGLDGERCMQAFDALGCERVSEYVRLHLTTDLFYDIEVGRISTAEFCAEVRRIAGCTAADADIVAALHAPETDVPQTDDSIPSPIQLIILKHRNGPTATIDMLFKKKTSTFLSLKKDGDMNEK